MKFKNPYVKRALLEAEQEKGRGLEYRCSSLSKDLEMAKRLAKEILPRLVNIKVYPADKAFGTYRVCVELHRDMVERAFTHGADENLIRDTAAMLGEEVAHKMIQFNFARCERI